MKRLALALGIVGIALLVAFLAWPRADAIDPARLDPPARAAQAKALEVWRLDASQVGMPMRAFSRRIAVTQIERDRGHCDAKVPGEFDVADSYDYRGRVASLGPDGIVLASARFICGGLQFTAE